MVVFRTFLYSICLVCFVWGLCVYAGPGAIKWFISSYSDDNLRPFDISVSPKLDVKIGRLEYFGQGPDGQSVRKGFSRSVNFSWSLSSGQPFIEATFGPTFLESLLSVESLIVYTPTYSDINFKKVLLKASVDDIEINSFGNARSLAFEGIYQSDLNLVTNLSADIPVMTLNAINSTVIKDFNTKTDKISLNTPAYNQELKLHFAADELTNDDQGINFFNLVGVVSLAEAKVDFDFNFSSIEFLNLGARSEKTNATGFYSTDSFSSHAQIKFSPVQNEKVVYDRPILLINASNLENGKLIVDVVGDLDPLQIVLDDNYIGTLPASSFQMNMRSQSRGSQVNVTSKIELKNAGSSKIEGSAELNAKFGKTQKLFDCLSLDCKILAFDGRYSLNFGQEVVSGGLECVYVPCNLLSLSHRLTTTNTVEIFKIINEVKIFNPIYSIYLYSLVSAGAKLQSGHLVEIN